jgi:hypothetical protein
MTKKVLLAALAGLSLLATAQTQSNDNKNTAKPATDGSVQASGQTTAHLPTKGVVHRDLAAREASSGMATGKTAVADTDGDGHSDRAVKPSYDVKSSTKGRVAAGDVNGDGAADRTAGSGYNIKNQTGARVAAGDVNGDGHADVAASSNSGGSTKPATASGQAGVKSPRDSSSGMPTGKRQHQPMTITK